MPEFSVRLFLLVVPRSRGLPEVPQASNGHTSKGAGRMIREAKMLDVAMEFRREGWYPVPIPHKKKGPTLQGWQNLRLDTPAQLAEHFNGSAQNIGVILGACSGNTVDTDLDQPECLAFAKWILPDTRQFGRPGNINSHWLFRSETDKTRVQFFVLLDGEDGKPRQHMFVELRANGHQTVFPPSTHESGEPIRWRDRKPLTVIDFAELEQRAGHVAAGAALAQAWPRAKGCRHSCEMALAGMLLRTGFSIESTERFILTIATIANTENAAQRARNVATTTEERLKQRKPVTGWKTLSQLLNRPELTSKVPDWLGYSGQAAEASDEARPGPSSGGRLSDTAPSFNLTDSGNGEFIAHFYGHRFRHDHARKRDLLFEGHRWREDATAELILIAKEAAGRRYLLAAEIPDPKEREKVARWAIQSEQRSRIEAALALARAEPPIADPGIDWDSRPMLLAVGNGVLDLETGKLRDGRPDDRLILHTPIPYDPHARCERFEQFVREIFQNNEELIDYVHRVAGYSTTGDTSEQEIYVCYGSGSNGKGKFFAATRAALGEYAHNIPFSTLELNERSSIPSDVAGLADRRFITASETNDGKRLNEARIKMLTGEDPVTARFLHAEWFTFRPVGKFWLAVNHRPRVSDDSYGFWRRVRLIPFTRQFIKGKDADEHIERKLLSELPGILAWLVRGCLEWQKRGLKPPDVVVHATESYRTESDPLSQFIAERCRVELGAVAVANELYKAYVAWAEQQGFSERERMTATMFGRRVSDRFRKIHTRLGNVYEGVELTCVMS
jgi:putative DNA primase/helicase